MNNKKNTKIKLNKTIYFTFIIVVLFYSNSFCDISSISPTINDHIHTNQWQDSGYPNGISSNNPSATITQSIGASDDIQYKITHYSNQYPGILTKIQLPAGTIYQLNLTLTIPSNIILGGNYQFKKDKALEDRTILEFDLGENTKNCIELIGADNSGVEDLCIKRIDSGSLPSSEKGHNILIQDCDNCWVSGVESYRPVKHHIDIYNSNHIEVRGCYFHDAQHYGEGGAGYGVLCNGSSYCLIEDNIFENLRHSMLVQNEANYNVFGYNYSIGAKQTNRPDLPDNMSGDMVCHGHPSGGPQGSVAGPMGNLFEGNIGQFMWVDLWHWSNGPDNTFHRNSAKEHGYHIYPLQKKQNIVNNYLKEGNRWLHLLGGPRYRLGSSTYFESHSQITYRNIWGHKRHKTIERNTDLENYDGDYYDTFANDESYYYNEQPNLLCTSWPFKPKVDNNSAKLRYNVGGYKHTKSRFDNSVVQSYFILEQDIICPSDMPVFMQDWLNSVDDIVIPDTVCLVIEPGVTLEFESDICMYVNGSLIAKGTDHNDGEIVFKSLGTGRWDGINISSAGGQILPCGVSEFEYCSFTKTKNRFGSPFNNGGAISASFVSYRNSPDLVISNCIFYNNRGEQGGAIYACSINDAATSVHENMTIIIEDCEIENNEADDYGGGICLWYCEILLRNNLIYENDDTEVISDLDGAGLALIHCDGDIINNSVFGNRGGGNSAAGLFFVGGNMNIINNTIYGNCQSKMFSDIGGQLFDNVVNFINNVAGKYHFVYWNSEPHDFYINFYNNYYTYSTYGLTCRIFELDSSNGYTLGNFLYLYPEKGNYINNIHQQGLPLPVYIGLVGGDDPLYFCSLEDYSDLIDRGITEDEFLSIDGLDIEDWNKLPSQDPIGNPRIAADILDMGSYEYYNLGIYLPQKDIDFGIVPHDIKETKELVIKNYGDSDLTNISITFADTIAEYYTIDPEDIPDIIPPSLTDSVCIPIEFCCNKMFVHCDGLLTVTTSDPYIPEVQLIVYGSPTLGPKWNWISFPELVRDDNGEQNAETVMEPLEPNAIQLLHDQTSMIYDYPDWNHDDLYNLNSTNGYKLEMANTYDYYPFEVYDSITVCDPETAFALDAWPEWNWIGYFIEESQNLDEAILDGNGNNRFDDILAIKAENWYYHKPFEDPHKSKDWGSSQPLPSNVIRPLHYGRGYLVQLEKNVNSFTAHWNNPNQNEENKFTKSETETFNFDEKADYEAIDVIGLDEGAEEIGVFIEEDCIGAAVVEDSSAQILAYTENTSRNTQTLNFVVSYGNRNSKSFKNYYVYNCQFKTFVEDKIVAGKQDYSIVRLNKEDDSNIEKIRLLQNYPNPFSPTIDNTSISYSLPKESNVEISVYNIKGQKVITLEDSKIQAGTHFTTWDGCNTNGNRVASGIYFYKLETEDKNITKKMLLIK
ncbi:MAG: T9SS type A sorting domain-containing protein [Candidatus Cloacimonadota bacterium]|nr:T9SS type A sorting domain-containing protein [Candidatus Cloacimonadota bacterium]